MSCACDLCHDKVEDEEHVVFVCPRTAELREQYGVGATSFGELFAGKTGVVGGHVNEVMKIYDSRYPLNRYV